MLLYFFKQLNNKLNEFTIYDQSTKGLSLKKYKIWRTKLYKSNSFVKKDKIMFQIQ